MPKHPTQRDQKRQNLIEAAIAVTAARGFQGAGIAEIAAVAGIAPANLYRYFAAKEDLVLAIVEAQRQEIARRLAEAQAGAGSARDALRRFMRAVTGAAIEPRMRALWLETLAEAARNPRIAQLLKADDGELAAAFRSLVDRARADGEIAPESDAAALAQLLIALMDGAMARAGYDSGFDLDGFVAACEGLLFAKPGPVR